MDDFFGVQEAEGGRDVVREAEQLRQWDRAGRGVALQEGVQVPWGSAGREGAMARHGAGTGDGSRAQTRGTETLKKQFERATANQIPSTALRIGCEHKRCT